VHESDDTSTSQNQPANNMEAIRAYFDLASRPIREAWRGIHEAVPGRLYHYTTLGGLEGIIESGAVWASDVRFMNDSSELTYASDLINEVIAESIASVSNDELREALPSGPTYSNAFEHGLRPFIACFCETNDLLSQWRGYGEGDLGMSLGLRLANGPLDDLGPNSYLRKVIYDPIRQRELTRGAVNQWIATAAAMMAAGTPVKDLFPYPAYWSLQDALAELYLCFKHPSFEEEKEWRLIKLVDVRAELSRLSSRRNRAEQEELKRRLTAEGFPWHDSMDYFSLGPEAEGVEINFRKSHLGLIPYVQLVIRDPAGVFHGRLPLEEVVQGPTNHPDLALGSMGVYLESRNYWHTKLAATAIPLRR
jgi:hypothetical protein